VIAPYPCPPKLGALCAPNVAPNVAAALKFFLLPDFFALPS